MSDCGYATARVAARFGARPQDGDWHRIELQRALAAVLDAARGTPLARWTAGVASGHDVHAIAAVLRGHRRALAAEIGGWMPAEWRPALAWLAVAPDLPVCAHLAAGRAPRRWMHDDVVYRALLAPGAGGDPGDGDGPRDTRGERPGERVSDTRGDRRDTAAAIARDAAPDAALATLTALAATGIAALPVGERWRVGWLRRLPRGAPPALAEAGTGVAAHFGAGVAAAHPGARSAPTGVAAATGSTRPSGSPTAAPVSAPAAVARAALAARLTRLYRRASGEPAAAFAYLGLALVDFERLEGELARRALFPDLPLAA